METPFFVVILPALTVLAVGLLGSTRRIGFFLAILASILLTPIGGLVLALLSGEKRWKPPKKPRKTPKQAS